MDMDDNDNKDRLDYLVNGGDSSVLKQLPPDFIRADDECPHVAHDDFSGHPIPLLSLDAPDAAHTVRSACQEWGIFHALHHGIEPALLDRLRHLGPAFFAQSADRKLLYDMRAGSASASASASACCLCRCRHR